MYQLCSKQVSNKFILDSNMEFVIVLSLQF